MRAAATAFVVVVVACGGSHPPPPAPLTPVAEEEPDAGDDAEDDTPPPVNTVSADTPESKRAPSTATYDEALSKPEPVDVGDEAPHLTDVQLTAPMNGALVGCRVLPNAKITIKTAVQYGRAIGVTVEVHVDKPKSSKAKKKPKPSTRKAEKKAIAKLTTCVDHNVRAIVWPPNRRRDSFTMTM